MVFLGKRIHRVLRGRNSELGERLLSLEFTKVSVRHICCQVADGDLSANISYGVEVTLSCFREPDVDDQEARLRVAVFLLQSVAGCSEFMGGLSLTNGIALSSLC